MNKCVSMIVHYFSYNVKIQFINIMFPFILYACSFGMNLMWFSTSTHRLLKPPKNIKIIKKILGQSYVTKVRYIFFNPYDDQKNNMVWSKLKLRLKTRTIFTFSGLQKAFYDEVQIMEHNYFKMTLTRYSKIQY